MATEVSNPIDLPKEGTSVHAVAPAVTMAISETTSSPINAAEADAPVATDNTVAAKENSVAADENSAALTPAVAAIPTVTDASKPAAAKVEPVETKSVDEGVLEHKKSAGFPKNLIFSKQTLWFGSDAIDPKDLHHYVRSEKFPDVAHHNAAWASTTGSGLLFYGDRKGHIAGIVNLADATEPESDGNQKFFFFYNGIKHTFKAHSKEYRDNWISQLKHNISSAKGKAGTVTEGTPYKHALESYKAKPSTSPTSLLPKEETTQPDINHDAKADDTADDSAREERQSGRRSASRKRLSVFNFNRKTKKEEEPKEDLSPTALAAADSAEPLTMTHKAAVDASPTAATAESVDTDALSPAEQGKLSSESPEDKFIGTPVDSSRPVALSKRSSIFGLLKRDKRSATTPEATPLASPTDAPSVLSTEVAPVIPPVNAITPLAVELSSPAIVPSETIDIATEVPSEKKEMRAEKRKPSIPFAFAKKEKSLAAEDLGEKREREGVFSRLRNTIKRNPSSAERIREKSETISEKADKTAADAASIKAPVEEAASETTMFVAAPATNGVPAVAPVTAAA